MSIKSVMLSLFLLIMLSGCERDAAISQPKHYETPDISFDYPSNWKIDPELTQDDSVTVQSVGDAIFSILIYEQSNVLELEELTTLFSGYVAKEAMPFGEIETISKDSISKTTPYGKIEGIKINLSMNLLGQKIPYTSEYYLISKEEKAVFLYSYTPTKDRKHTDPGFNLIIQSFKIK